MSHERHQPPLKLTPLLVTLAAAYPVLGYSANAARMDFVSGNVVAVSPGGNSRNLNKGDEVSAGDTISTRDGRAQVRFSDGAMVSLQPQTDFRVDAYQYSGKADGSEQGFFSLLKGGMRTITGWIGRTNKENYRVTTNVATIGIRGTEYSITYGNGITVTTGEGQVQVCNAGGCLLLAGGESAFVSAPSAQPVRTEARTSLPPSQPTVSPQVFFATGEDRTTGGASSSISGAAVPVLPSGSGYSLAWAGSINGSPTFNTESSGTATFASTGEPTLFSGANLSITPGNTVGYASDGVLGWGRWATATGASMSSFNMTNTHFVIGQPTSTAELTALAGRMGTYSLIGFTFPTSSSGVVGTQAISGSVVVNFSASSTVFSSLTVPIGGQTYGLTSSAMVFGGSSFYNSATCSGCTASTSAYISGFIAGQNGSHVGLSYKFDTGGSLGTVLGAAAFKQTSLGTIPQ